MGHICDRVGGVIKREEMFIMVFSSPYWSV